MLKQPAPPGFTIGHGGPRKRWGWKQDGRPKSPSHDTERWGFATRRDAFADLQEEIARRAESNDDSTG